MRDPTELDVLIRECEKASVVLENLDPNHELLRFDATGLTSREQDLLLDLLLDTYGPPGYKSDCPTDDQLVYTFRQLLAAIRDETERLAATASYNAITKAQYGEA